MRADGVRAVQQRILILHRDEFAGGFVVRATTRCLNYYAQPIFPYS
jgi:hypothetical protein